MRSDEDQAGGEIRSIYSDAVGDDDDTMMEFDALMDQHDREIRDAVTAFTEDELTIVKLIFSSEYDPIDDNVEEAFMSALKIIRHGARVIKRPAFRMEMGRAASIKKHRTPVNSRQELLGHVRRVTRTIAGSSMESSPSLIPIDHDADASKAKPRAMRYNSCSGAGSGSTGDHDVEKGE